MKREHRRITVVQRPPGRRTKMNEYTSKNDLTEAGSKCFGDLYC